MGDALARDAARRLSAEYERIRHVRHAPGNHAVRTQVSGGGLDRRIDDLTEEMLKMFQDLANECNQDDMPDGIDFEEKAFYDILKALAIKYKFQYPEDKLIDLAKQVKAIVDDQAKFPDWNNRADIKAALKVNLIIALAENGYPPVDRNEVYQEIFEQAENFKKYQSS